MSFHHQRCSISVLTMERLPQMHKPPAARDGSAGGLLASSLCLLHRRCHEQSSDGTISVSRNPNPFLVLLDQLGRKALESRHETM